MQEWCDCGHRENASEKTMTPGGTKCRKCMNAHLKPKADGGPVYPQINEQRYNDPIHGVIYPSDMCGPAHPGISRRDWLAGLAMQSLCGNLASDGDETSAQRTARLAYEYADAMIEQGKK